MSEPTGQWEAQPKYQRDLDPGELEELNRLRAWKEHQEREEQERRHQEQQIRPAFPEPQAPAAPPYPYAQQPSPYPGAEHPRHHAAYPPPPQQQFTPIQQVTVNNVKRAECPHLLHLVLTLITCGAWLPIWIIHAIIVAARG